MSCQDSTQAYKKLSLVYHPDKTAGMGADQKEEPSPQLVCPHGKPQRSFSGSV